MDESSMPYHLALLTESNFSNGQDIEHLRVLGELVKMTYQRIWECSIKF